ncbi:beta-lactamase-like protein [Dactylonectria estremocensis]|uniref:Cleavage and polyadenylation specificity factor subunit 2 n=1 Tax=Dactylonectria estremocensis TaxID=1079267 RepID=A0A9P9ITD8_9HYPO|nr:beta-lactamase-like protein [Dactylonectria estremocensis]
MFTFCPLQGALSDSPASQSLLELDGGVKVLVDLGWDESFDVEKLKEIENDDSFADSRHPRDGVASRCIRPLLQEYSPVYAHPRVCDATSHRFGPHPHPGPLFVDARGRDHDPSELALRVGIFILPDHGERAEPLATIADPRGHCALLFSDPTPQILTTASTSAVSLFAPLNGLTITAYNSGHTLGGTIWHIQHGLESIVYAVDWNQARENVFAGAAWLGGAGGGGAEVIEQLRKPTALICSSRGSDRNAPAGGRTKRDEQLIDTIKACVTRGGTVLIPVDSSARVLELSYLLEHAWRADAASAESVLKSAKLYLAGRNMSSTMRYARSMLEWMDDSIVQEFEAFAEDQRKVNGATGKKEGGPLDFKYLRLLERKAQIERLLSHQAENGATEGRVILASDTSIEWGFSKDLIRGLAKDSRNLVILTDKPGLAKDDKPSIARTLWDWWKEKRDGVAVEQSNSGDIELVYAGGRELEIKEAQRQALEGEELSVYQQWLATQRQLQATQQSGGASALEASADVVDDASSESSSDSEDDDGEQQGKALNVSTTLGQVGRKNVVLNDADLGINVLIKKKNVYDFDSRGKKGRERSFPVAIRRRRNDDFGELIRPEDYLRAEEKEEDNADAANLAAMDDKLGKKRKWDDVAKNGPGGNKRNQTGRAGSVDDGDGPGDGFVPDELDAVEDAESHEPTGPCKLVYQTESVTANLRIAFVDFSGLHDKRSLNMLIPLIQPRKLILVGGGRDETLELAEDCRKALGANGERAVDVYTPEVGVAVDASVDTNAWVVKLADPLVKKIKWQNVRGLGIVTITGQLLATHLDNADEDPANKRQKTEPTAVSTALTNGQPALPTLDVLPSNLVSAVRSAAQPLHVGDLRLADLRRAMQAAGHGAEFRGEGTLVVDGTVAVRKTAAGRVEVESVGLPTTGRRTTFYEVRRVIYDNLAVVAGA